MEQHPLKKTLVPVSARRTPRTKRKTKQSANGNRMYRKQVHPTFPVNTAQHNATIEELTERLKRLEKAIYNQTAQDGRSKSDSDEAATDLTTLLSSLLSDSSWAGSEENADLKPLLMRLLKDNL